MICRTVRTINRSTTKPISINRAVTTCAVTNLESKYTPPDRIPISKVSRMMRDHLISLLGVVLDATCSGSSLSAGTLARMKAGLCRTQVQYLSTNNNEKVPSEYDMSCGRGCSRPLLSICLYSRAGYTAGLRFLTRSDACAELHS